MIRRDKVLAALIMPFVGFGLVYLAGSFACADFNIVNWDAAIRGFVALMGVVGGVITTAIAIESL